MNYTLLKLIRVVVFFRKNDKQLENACITGDPRWGGGIFKPLVKLVNHLEAVGAKVILKQRHGCT